MCECRIPIVLQKVFVKIKLGHVCKVPDPHQVPSKRWAGCHLTHHTHPGQETTAPSPLSFIALA